ncbi:MAG: DUF5317 domain-containing protein [Chloroflexota bacterium]
MFGVAILAGVLAGWMRGGQLWAIGAARIRLAWLIPLGLAAQVVMIGATGLDVPWWVLPLHLATYALLFTTIVANWRMSGLPVIGVGLLMNALVIFSNGGLMPQAPETLHVMHAGEEIAIGQHIPRSKDVLLPRAQTHLWWLSDVVTMPRGSPVQMVFSLGDVVVALGLAWTVRGLMQPLTPQTQRLPQTQQASASWRNRSRRPGHLKGLALWQ